MGDVIIPAGRGTKDVQLLVLDRASLEAKTPRICNVGESGEIYLRAGRLAEATWAPMSSIARSSYQISSLKIRTSGLRLTRNWPKREVTRSPGQNSGKAHEIDCIVLEILDVVLRMATLSVQDAQITKSKSAGSEPSSAKLIHISHSIRPSCRMLRSCGEKRTKSLPWSPIWFRTWRTG